MGAAQTVYSVLKTKFERGIKDVRFVAERLDYFRDIAGKFEDALVAHLMNLLQTVPTLATGKRKGDGAMPIRLSLLDRTLTPFGPLVQLIGLMNPQKHLQFKMAYESIARTVLTAEMAEIFEWLRTHNLISKTPDEKPSCKNADFISFNYFPCCSLAVL